MSTLRTGLRSARRSTRAHGPGGGHRLPDRSATRGDEGGGVPQPTGSSTAGRPTQEPWNRSPDGRRRAHGRAHGHTCGGTRRQTVHGAYRARTCARTTIPPTGTMPLNAWDAANYAGFTNAAWLCQRGSRLCRGVAHVQGATRAEREARRRSRPRGNQQRGTRPPRQRPWRATRVDASLRQDVRGALGVEGHGAAGCGAAPHRRRHRPEARPAGAAPRDRPGGRRSRARSGSRLPEGRGPGGEVRDGAVPPRPRRPPRRLRRDLAVARRVVRSQRVRDARLTLADNPRRQLGRAGGGLRRGVRRIDQSRPQ
ncbi:hypothetical protein SCANM63S_03248 [Streptomyces canarius]